MAITILNSPPLQHSTFNPVLFVVDSTNKAETGFRYIVDIKDTLTSEPLINMDIAPEPINQYGYVDISKILQNKLFPNLVDPTSTTVRNASGGTEYKYTVNFGEKLIESYPWFFTMSYVMPSLGYVYTRLDFITDPGFVVGDQVNVSTDTIWSAGTADAALNGSFTIVEVITGATTTLVINLPWNNFQFSQTGNMTYADERKINYTGLTATTKVALNISMEPKDFIDTINNYYNSGTTPSFVSLTDRKFMTSMPRTEFWAGFNQSNFLNLYDGTNIMKYMYFINESGRPFRYDISASMDIKQIPIGPYNLPTLTPLSGDSLIDQNCAKRDTKRWYTMYATDINGNRLTEIIKMNLDFRERIEDIEILFMDKWSSWLSYGFQNRKFENISIEKNQYHQDIIDLNPDNNYYYELRAIANKTYNVKTKKEFVLNSNWVKSDEMSTYFEDLVASPETYIKWTDGEWYSCDIKPTTYNTERSKNKRLIKKSVTITFDLTKSVNI